MDLKTLSRLDLVRLIQPQSTQWIEGRLQVVFGSQDVVDEILARMPDESDIPPKITPTFPENIPDQNSL